MEALHLPYGPCHWDTPPSLGGENEREARKKEQEPRRILHCVVFNREAPKTAVPIRLIQGVNTENVKYFSSGRIPTYLQVLSHLTYVNMKAIIHVSNC